MHEKSMWQADSGTSISGLLPESPEQKWGSGSRGTLGSEQLTRQISLTKDDVFRKHPSSSKLFFYLGRAYSLWRHPHLSLCQIVRDHWPFLMSLSIVIAISNTFFFPSQENTSQSEFLLSLRHLLRTINLQKCAGARDQLRWYGWFQMIVCTLQPSNTQRGICISIPGALTLVSIAQPCPQQAFNLCVDSLFPPAAELFCVNDPAVSCWHLCGFFSQ